MEKSFGDQLKAGLAKGPIREIVLDNGTKVTRGDWMDLAGNVIYRVLGSDDPRRVSDIRLEYDAHSRPTWFGIYALNGHDHVLLADIRAADVKIVIYDGVA